MLEIQQLYQSLNFQNYQEVEYPLNFFVSLFVTIIIFGYLATAIIIKERLMIMMAILFSGITTKGTITSYYEIQQQVEETNTAVEKHNAPLFNEFKNSITTGQIKLLDSEMRKINKSIHSEKDVNHFFKNLKMD